MKSFFLLSCILTLNYEIATADTFREEASQLARDLKSVLMKEVSSKISSEGTVHAISFCHENVSTVAKKVAGDRISRFKFGRTSHKIRNRKNAPEEWMKPYIEKYKNTKAGAKDSASIHQFPDGKRAYVEPLFIQPVCLKCHGPNVSQSVNDKIKALYPEDEATGFKAGEFRGLLWIKEQ